MTHWDQGRDGGGTGRGQMCKFRAVGDQMRGLIQSRESEGFLEEEMAELSPNGQTGVKPWEESGRIFQREGTA